MKNYFKLYEEYTRPRQFLFDIESDLIDAPDEEKFAYEWEFRGEKIKIVEGKIDEEITDVTITLVDSKGNVTTDLFFDCKFHSGPPGISSKDYAKMTIKRKGSSEKEYDVENEYIEQIESYSFMKSMMNLYEHTFTREGHYIGKDYGIS